MGFCYSLHSCFHCCCTIDDRDCRPYVIPCMIAVLKIRHGKHTTQVDHLVRGASSAGHRAPSTTFIPADHCTQRANRWNILRENRPKERRRSSPGIPSQWWFFFWLAFVLKPPMNTYSLCFPVNLYYVLLGWHAVENSHVLILKKTVKFSLFPYIVFTEQY
jgi:hypothetical protein